MPIYAKPTKELLREMIASWALQPGQVFTTARAVEWFRAHYPDLKRGTITGHLTRMSTNDRGRLHHRSLARADDVFFKVDSGQYRLYAPSSDPAPIHELVEGDVALQDASSASDVDEVASVDDAPPGSSEFLLERDLQRYLAENLQVVEPGLRLYVDPEGLSGIEYPASNRRIDILAVDRNGAFVVLELKVARGYDRVVGQLYFYMNWVRMNLAEPGQKVRGVILCREISQDLRIACSSSADVELCEYELSVRVKKLEQLQAPTAT